METKMPLWEKLALAALLAMYLAALLAASMYLLATGAV